MEIETVQEMHRLLVFIYIRRYFGSSSGLFTAVCQPFLFCSGLSMPYIVIRTKFYRGRDQADVHPHLFVRLTAAKQHARRWKQQDQSRQRRQNRFVYSVHKVCLVPDYTTTLWHI